MIATCLRSGWRAATSRPRLILTLWAWSTLLALVVGWGTSRWLAAAFGWSPEADRALQRFHLGLFVELTQYDRFSPFTFLGGAAFALMLLAALSSALLAAGVLEVLVSGDSERPLLHRFFRGAGHFFGRFLRLSIVTAVAALVVLFLVSAATRPIVSALGESSWERTWIVAGLMRWLVLCAVLGVALAILDVARTGVCMASPEQRGMLRAWLRSARFVFAHAGGLTGIYLALGACWVAVALAGLAIVFAVPATSWFTIWLLILLQQAFMMARATIRVARAGAIVQCVRLTAARAERPEASGDSAYSADSAVSPVSTMPPP